ncbi:hypothetical protein [Capnocytophaga sputigena]|uniref:hypothetical protein n=1 Tax=Capnocytophaga sputigena TaxID=1019 RepID=UPI003C76D827
MPKFPTRAARTFGKDYCPCGSPPEDLKAIALSKEQGNLGMVTSNDDVFKEIQYFRSSKQQLLF